MSRYAAVVSNLATARECFRGRLRVSGALGLLAIGVACSSTGGGAAISSSTGGDSTAAGSRAVANGGQTTVGGAGASTQVGGAPGSSGGASNSGGAGTAAGGGTSGRLTDAGGTGGATGVGNTAGGGAVAGGVTYPYVFAVFNDSAPVSDLEIYTSKDALNFTLLSATGYTGPTGFLRDPSIMKHRDGKFYVAFTTPPDLGCCGPQTSFAVASSSDLKKWTTVTQVPSGVAGTKNVWAPEWFKDSDGSLHILVTLDGNTYRYEPTDDTLTKFGAGTPIGIGPGYIDTFVVKLTDTYHAFSKGNGYIEHATATSLSGPWTFIGKNDWSGWGTHKEAPALVDLGNGTWRFYCDAGSTGHEVYSDSTDVFLTWTPPKGLPTVGNSISHGTVIHGG